MNMKIVKEAQKNADYLRGELTVNLLRDSRIFVVDTLITCGVHSELANTLKDPSRIAQLITDSVIEVLDSLDFSVNDGTFSVPN